jgi:transcriptional regulator with XRE-family HTH domain
MYTLTIKKIRRIKHLTLEQLSELCGISVSQLSRLEADNIVRNRTTTLTTLENIAISMKICPNDILWYDCKNCELNKTCPKHKVNLDEIIEENLSFYI